MTHPAKLRETVNQLNLRFNKLQRGEKCCFGVTMSQCLTLETLHQQDRRTVRDLAQGLALDTSTVTRVVDVLVRDGLVRRARDEKGDRRRVFVSLTERGRRLAKKLESSADDYCERILERIPPDRHEDVLQALLLVVSAIDELPEGMPDGST
jgi:DNA-binding MarR family transcriptional regulator